MAAKGKDILEVADVDELIDRGLVADEEQDFDVAELILDEAGNRLGENHPRVLHLAGRNAWAHGDIDRATGFFQQAVDQKPQRPEIYIDCARCLHLLGEDDGPAESLLRTALAMPNIDSLQAGDAGVLLSRIRLDDEDPEEALELLDAIPDELKTHALYLSARADALVELDRLDEALACVAKAVEIEPEDADYHYQQGLLLQSVGSVEAGAVSMLRVLELESEQRGPSTEPTGTEVQELRVRLEGVMEELPDPLLALVANVPITVQARATADQIRAGADPRGAVFFLGTPKDDDHEAVLTGVVVARDLLVDQVEDEDDVDEVLLVAMAGEIADFFGRDDLIYAGAEP